MATKTSDQENTGYFGSGSSKVLTRSTASERDVFELLQQRLGALLPQFGAQFVHFVGICLPRHTLSRILYYSMLYERIVNIPGVICEFGVQWGTTMALLSNLRGMFEPYNHTRRIVGFDTFEGFLKMHEADGQAASRGDYSVSPGYEKQLSEILSAHEALSPIPHIKKHELVKGDVCQTLPKWLDDNPQAIISMAILDMDLYEPTKFVLERIGERLTKGSLLVFDELNCIPFPGETVALREAIGLKNLNLRRYEHQSHCAYAVVE
jgi:Macrocin-O-methyltransferase (TylF)